MIRDITTVTSGLIMHQVNCQNVMGSGVARALYEKYPTVKSEFHRFSQANPNRLGQLQEVVINESLSVFNSFSQFDYGNDPTKLYTDYEALFRNLLEINRIAKERGVTAYVPYRIGCGLANGDWDIVSTFIEKETDIVVVKP